MRVEDNINLFKKTSKISSQQKSKAAKSVISKKENNETPKKKAGRRKEHLESPESDSGNSEKTGSEEQKIGQICWKFPIIGGHLSWRGIQHLNIFKFIQRKKYQNLVYFRCFGIRYKNSRLIGPKLLPLLAILLQAALPSLDNETLKGRDFFMGIDSSLEVS